MLEWSCTQCRPLPVATNFPDWWSRRKDCHKVRPPHWLRVPVECWSISFDCEPVRPIPVARFRRSVADAALRNRCRRKRSGRKWPVWPDTVEFDRCLHHTKTKKKKKKMKKSMNHLPKLNNEMPVEAEQKWCECAKRVLEMMCELANCRRTPCGLCEKRKRENASQSGVKVSACLCLTTTAKSDYWIKAIERV